MGTPSGAGAPFLSGIQVLRAVAALAVVLHHVEKGINTWFAPDTQLPNFSVGAAGVDLFFMISGFIMVVTSRELSAGTFVSRRLFRIVPLYWLSILVFAAAALVVPQREGQDYSLSAFAASLFFIPYARPDGSVLPLNPVGWTLNYEMLFYALFAFALLFARNRVVPTVAAVLTTGVVTGLAVPSDWVALDFWTAPIVLEFAAGMAVAQLFLSGFRLGRSSAVMLGGLAVIGFAAIWDSPEPMGWDRLVFWGGPSLVLLTATVLAPERIMPSALVRLGDASYALYLFHMPLLLVFKHFGSKLQLPWGAPMTPWLVAFAVTALSIALGLAIYALFERPTTQRLRRRFELKPSLIG